MTKSETIAELAKAMCKAQSEIENASKNSSNPHFKSKYADLAEVLNTVRPTLTNNGISISQFPAFENGIASVETIVMHTSGEWMMGTSSAPVGKQDAQGVGSALTYLRRYSLAAIAGIAQEDDDGNGAVGSSGQGGRQQQANKPQQQANRQPFNADAAVNAINGAPDKQTVNQYVQAARQRGATDQQMQSINEAAMTRLASLEQPA